jgi:chemotaxis protein MotB
VAASRRRRHEEEEHENHERWLVSYADMITLLAALFIVLFAMSSLDLAKFREFANALRSSLSGSSRGEVIATASPAGGVTSPWNGGGSLVDGGGFAVAPAPVQLVAANPSAARSAAQWERAHLEDAEAVIRDRLRAAGLAGEVRFRLEARGLVVNIVTDDVLFDSGSATLRPEGRRVLDGLAVPLASLPNPISVEGHTDDRPVHGAFASNWELSTARATAVLRYLADGHALPVARLSASGYADQKPLVPNDSEANRAANRRVEVVVVSRAGAGVTAADPG